MIDLDFSLTETGEEVPLPTVALVVSGGHTSLFVVRDVGSLNGTYVNRESVQCEATLHDGDEILIDVRKLSKTFKTGLFRRRVVEAIKGGAAQCWTLDVKPERLFAGNRNPGFKAYMQAKDLGIVMDTAREYGIPVPGVAVHTQLFTAMLEMGMREMDNSAVVGVIESLANVDLLGD
mgnify:CR=1 FL=1